jgi:hypothetical protein
MPAPQSRKWVIATFTPPQKNGSWLEETRNIFIGFAFVGVLLSLLLMIFIPGLRSVGASIQFSAVFAGFCTLLGIITEAFAKDNSIRSAASTANNVIAALTGTCDHALTVAELKELRYTRDTVPLPIHGVPGLGMRVMQQHPRNAEPQTVTAAANSKGAGHVVITVTPPDYGIASFDRLLADAARKI